MTNRLAALAASTILGVLLLAGGAAASPPDTQPSILGTQSVPSTGLLRSGLIDPTRLSFSHSLSYSFSSSSTEGDRSGGLWLTRASYRVSDPLHLDVDLGAVIDPSGNGPLMDKNSFFLRGVQLDYRPSKNFRLNVSYVNLPAKARSVLPYGGYGLGYGPLGSPLGLDR